MEPGEPFQTSRTTCASITERIQEAMHTFDPALRNVLVSHLRPTLPSTNTMSTSLQVTSNFQPILDSALKEYKKKTGKELITHSLAEEITSCDSPEAILTVLQGKANGLSQSQSSDERLTKWLTPTVNVLNTLSVTLGEGVGTVFPPSKIVFSAISILLVAARDTAMSRDVLIELFDRIEDFFVRLQTYTEVPPTAEVTKVMGKVMAEVLSMLAIATKEMKQGRTKTFFKKLVGRTDIEDALQKLDKLEQGELRTVIAQVLKATSDIKDGVKRIEVIAQQIGTDVGARDWEQLLRDLRGWLSPPDPSTNHDIMCNAQHESTAAWVFNEGVFKEWESSGSLLWVHGKAGSGKSVLCSAIIQHVITLCDAGSASMAYFYFDFRDVDKKHRRNLLPSLLIQLSSRSESHFNILSRLYSDHGNGRKRPNERALVRCLNEMLMVPSLLTYIVLDALDECPNTSGIPTPRGQVLEFVKDLVDLRLPNLRICVTSRPEIDIRTALEPLTSSHFSLHNQSGQQRDITGYISSVVQSDPQMTRWREDDRKLVAEKLSEKADGMFRWVFCQLEVLRHCLAPSLRRQLNELPKSLDETYERVLKEIESTNQGRHARRLLQCLAVAMRPLRVEELAEVLAFDLDAVKEEIPVFHAEWRWEDQEQAVLSACSSLVSIVGSDDSRVVQFSHFSVKEYLTSDRLAAASGDVSQYHIVPEPAHLILAQVCVGALLRWYTAEWEEESDVGSINMRRREEGMKDIPLFMYAAEHWTSHAQVGSVSSCLKDAMEDLFDVDQSYFWAWIRIYDTDREEFMEEPQPLYYSARCGFYDMVQYLITEHPEQVNDGYIGSYHLPWHTPLIAALSGRHPRVAELLVKHGACVNVRGDPALLRILLVNFPDDARVGAVQFLLEHGAWVNAASKDLLTPMHMAAERGLPEIAQMLFEHGADADIRDNYGSAPLHRVSARVMNEAKGRRTILARLLVVNGADVNAQDRDGMTPLHCASQHGEPEIAQLLLDHGANAHAEDIQGRNPLHEVSRRRRFGNGSDEYIRPASLLIDAYRLREALNVTVARLLLEHGVDVNSIDKDHATPLHLASSYGMLEMARLLLDHGANANAENVSGQTPLHLVSQSEDFSHENPDVARLFLELGMNVNKQDKTQATPLHFACSHGNFNIALALLDHGAEVNARNADGQTPLLHPTPVSSNLFGLEDPRVAQLMLERGADANARDKDQATPLHLASYQAMPVTVQVLLEHGAEADARNADGQTPLHQVSKNSYDSHVVTVVQLLLDRGVDVNTHETKTRQPRYIWHPTMGLQMSQWSCLSVGQWLMQRISGARLHCTKRH
ncbi:ankyrin repeat-containing domain protein [Lactarius deliciosus]|nr:ankyrin repeat-containing domain protein [Lactarius deliciosus]